MTKRFITKKAKELAEQLHKEEHLIIENKIQKNHGLKEWYYLMASGIFNHVDERLEELHIEIHNAFTEVYDLMIDLEKRFKEVEKQQKYLWQTLEEKQEPKVLDLIQNKSLKKIAKKVIKM